MEVNQNFSENAKNDYALVLRALDGDQKAFAEIMDRYKDAIYFMMLKMVSNKEDAMDLTVETFAKAFEKIDAYKPEFAFSTWLFKLASNNSIDYIRRKKVTVISLDQLSEKEGLDKNLFIQYEGLNPEEKSIKKQQQNHLKEVVSKLPNRYRILINLYYFEELSVEEIALQLDLPKNTIKGQLSRGRDLLSNILKRKKTSGF
ncbi:MAG: RNA polymerase sigma factor [Sphingobacteriaceae bacterium]